jgi:Mce-associated membrane protein
MTAAASRRPALWVLAVALCITTLAAATITGDFLTYFKSFTSTQVRPTALNKHITQTASVVRIGIDTLTPQAASLVLFIDQTTSSRDRPEPLKTTSAVHESLVKVDSTWLINKFDPL